MINVRLKIMFRRFCLAMVITLLPLHDSHSIWNPFKKKTEQPTIQQQSNRDEMMATLDAKKLHDRELLDFIAHRKGEHYLGSHPSKALVQVVIYGSMSCPHCANVFLDIVPQLRKKYLDIEDSKVIFIHRSFVGDRQSMNGTQLLECKSNMTNDEYFRLLKVLYKEQMSWVYYNDDYIPKLKNIGSNFGITTEMFETCMRSRELEGKIIQDRINAVEKVGLRATPMILVNGKMINNYEYRSLASEIDNILKQ